MKILFKHNTCKAVYNGTDDFMKTETCLSLVHDNVLKCTLHVLNVQVIWNTALQDLQDKKTDRTHIIFIVYFISSIKDFEKSQMFSGIVL
jgi:hypothetical protein